MADPATYRSKAEVEEERKNDPIPKLREYLIRKSMSSEAELDAMDTVAKHVSEEAVKFADASPEPALEELWRDTIVDEGEEDVLGFDLRVVVLARDLDRRRDRLARLLRVLIDVHGRSSRC